MSPERAKNGVRRNVTAVKRGWHVQLANGAWRLVEQVNPTRDGGITLWFSDPRLDPENFYGSLTTRTPEEQMVATHYETVDRVTLFHELRRRRSSWVTALAALIDDETKGRVTA